MTLPTEFRQVAVARVFVLLAVGAPVLWGRDVAGVQGLAAVTVVWALLLSLELRRPDLGARLLPLEGAVVGMVCGLTPELVALFGVLAVPPFVAGLRTSLRGVGLVLAAELAATVATSVATQGGLTADASLSLLTWTTLGLGLGLVAGFFRRALANDDEVAPYRHASHLLRELNDLTAGLSSGIEPRSVGGRVLSQLRDHLPAAAVGLYVPHGDSLTTLVSKTYDGGDLAVCAHAATRAWTSDPDAVWVDDHAFGFALRADKLVVAIIGGQLAAHSPTTDLDLPRLVRSAQRHLADEAHVLNTGLLFAAFRDNATADERRRLSREMHDGVAQDIASLGYVVDALLATASSAAQERQLTLLRERITNVVSEVRRSVMTLRTSVGGSESLGSAVGSVARNLAQVSGIAIEVVLDETPQRLSPEVESELFRIVQEALNNAVKHAECQTIRVHCRVTAPSFSIEVSDDGRGLGDARTDSYGLRIMQERARLVGAHLMIAPSSTGGVAVRVTSNAPTEDNAGRSRLIEGAR